MREFKNVEYDENGKMINFVEGGKQAAKTIKQKYGENFYNEIGKKGGKTKVPKGFATMSKEKHLEASSKGGSRERVKNEEVQN